MGGGSAKPAPGAAGPLAEPVDTSGAAWRRTPYEEADEELRERVADAQERAVRDLAAQLTRWNDKVTEPRLKAKPLIM